MKLKILNLLLIITSLFGYLEWGQGQHMFLFQMECEIFSKIVSDPHSLLHPLIIMPLVGQVLLLITVFQKNPGRMLTLIGLIGLSLLLYFIFFIGWLEMDFKIILCALPFVLVSILSYREWWLQKRNSGV